MEYKTTGDELELVLNNIGRGELLSRQLSEWSNILKKEWGVYLLDDQFLCRKLDQINYRLTDSDKAKEILMNNLDILLTYKYFPNPNDEEIQRISEIKKYYSNRIATAVLSVKFTDSDSIGFYMQSLPASCIAFNNGVFDFNKNEWLFKYDLIKINETRTIISYPMTYRIRWYINRNFEPYEKSPLKKEFKEWIETLRYRDLSKKSLFFELFYNMSYDKTDEFSYDKAMHLAECYGFLLYAPFSEHFVFFVGDGSNGKDSMFDAFFRNCIVPLPLSVGIESLEQDKFALGALSKVSQNICSETEGGVIKKSAVLKTITGSEIQTMQPKGVDQYAGYFNVKFVFSANNKEQIKFGDASKGFRRRINLYECFFTWDKNKQFLRRFPKSYDTTYRDASELRDNDGLRQFIYTCRFGIQKATNNFTRPFNFTENDYTPEEYTDGDTSLKVSIGKLTTEAFKQYLKNNKDRIFEIFRSTQGMQLNRENKESQESFMYLHQGEDFETAIMDELTIRVGTDGEVFTGTYLENNTIYICIRDLRSIVLALSTPAKFSQDLKKMYPNCSMVRWGANSLYVKAFFQHGDLKIAQ